MAEEQNTKPESPDNRRSEGGRRRHGRATGQQGEAAKGQQGDRANKQQQPQQRQPKQQQPKPQQPKQQQPKQQQPKQQQPKPQQPKQQQEKAQQPVQREGRVSIINRRQTRSAAILAEPAPEVTPESPTPVAHTVDEYIHHLHGWQREVVMTLRNIVKSQIRSVNEKILWSQPVYSLNGPVCYIKAFTDHVNFGFWRGTEIDDPESILSGELPTMRHVTIRSVTDVNRELFEKMVRQAFKLDKEKGDATA